MNRFARWVRMAAASDILSLRTFAVLARKAIVAATRLPLSCHPSGAVVAIRVHPRERSASDSTTTIHGCNAGGGGFLRKPTIYVR